MRSRTNAGRGSEPTTEVAKRTRLLMCEGNSSGPLASPVFLRQLEIFLRVHFQIVSRRVGVGQFDAGFNHFLIEMNQVRLLEECRFAKWFAGKLLPRTMKMFAQLSRSSGSKLRDA